MVTALEQFAIVHYFNKGGPVMWALLVLSIIGVFWTFERLYHYRKVSINTPEFLKKIRMALEANKIQDAVTMCENYKGPIAAILKAGLLKFGKPREEVELAIAGAGGVEMARLERGFMWLATVISLAPLLGFLGTVTGMIRAFEAIAAHGLNNPSLVASGISEALITTAAGLMIAAPILIAYNYFNQVVNRMVLEMEESSGLILEYLDELRSSQQE